MLKEILKFWWNFN